MEKEKIKLAIVGTQGIPNQYGGFEALAEHIAKHLSNQFEITVFCSSIVYDKKLPESYGCKLKYLPLKANGIQSVVYDIISILKSVRIYDKILILGASGGIILPLLKRYKKKFILNFGGLDWKRSKWGRFAKVYLKLSEALSVKNCAVLISDNAAIQQYIKQEYNKESILVEYGGDQISRETIDEGDVKKYPFLNQRYALSVARIQPDNNIEMIFEAFNNASLPLVFIGNWNTSKYGNNLKARFGNQGNIILLDAIYEQKELNKIRSNCSLYIHGHSAGGTNPSLVEAMNLGLPIFCYASGFNENTTEYKAFYFNSKTQLHKLVETIDEIELQRLRNEMKLIAERRYKWNLIAEKYAACFNN